LVISELFSLPHVSWPTALCPVRVATTTFICPCIKCRTRCLFQVQSVKGVKSGASPARVWPVVNPDVGPGAACFSPHLGERAAPPSLPAFTRVHVSEADRLFGALGMTSVQRLGCGCGKWPLIGLCQRALDLRQWQEVKITR